MQTLAVAISTTAFRERERKDESLPVLQNKFWVGHSSNGDKMLVCPGAASEFLHNWGPGITSYLEGRDKAFVLK